VSEFPVATTRAPGVMAVDWEERVNFERLRSYRLARVHEQLNQTEFGAVLLFETSNIRYATSTTIGYWGFNKTERWALVTRTGGPYIWDFGSAAKAHRLQLPSMYDTNNSRPRQPRSPGRHRPHFRACPSGWWPSSSRFSRKKACTGCRSASTSPRP
jgi:hypothetical protein